MPAVDLKWQHLNFESKGSLAVVLEYSIHMCAILVYYSMESEVKMPWSQSVWYYQLCFSGNRAGHRWEISYLLKDMKQEKV